MSKFAFRDAGELREDYAPKYGEALEREPGAAKQMVRNISKKTGLSPKQVHKDLHGDARVIKNEAATTPPTSYHALKGSLNKGLD